jgi:hypothetical protein
MQVLNVRKNEHYVSPLLGASFSDGMYEVREPGNAAAVVPFLQRLHSQQLSNVKGAHKPCIFLLPNSVVPFPHLLPADVAGE